MFPTASKRPFHSVVGRVAFTTDEDVYFEQVPVYYTDEELAVVKSVPHRIERSMQDGTTRYVPLTVEEIAAAEERAAEHARMEAAKPPPPPTPEQRIDALSAQIAELHARILELEERKS